MTKDNSKAQLCRRPSTSEWKDTGITWLIANAVNLTISIILALVLNAICCEDASGCMMKGPFPWSPKATFVNFLEASCKTVGATLALTPLRSFAKRFCHPRIYGVFTFLAYCSFTTFFVANTYSKDNDPTASSQAAIQIKTIFGLTWSNGVMSWPEIAQAADFYDWMQYVMKPYLAAQTSNAHFAGGLFAPALQPYVTPDGVGAPGLWVNVGCSLRQQRVKLVPADEVVQSLGSRWRLPVFSMATQNTTARTWNVNGTTLQDVFTDDTFVNGAGVAKTSLPLAGSTVAGSIQYTGCSGHRFPTARNGSFTNWISGKMGEWDEALFDADIAVMKKISWIDAKTAMVQSTCFLVNPSIGKVMVIMHILEFTNSGLVRPHQTPLTISMNLGAGRELGSYATVSAPLLYFFYHLAVEIEDVRLQGMDALTAKTFGNAIDYFALMAAFALYVTGGLHTAYTPGEMGHIDHFWSWMSYHTLWQQINGIFLMLLVFKGLKFTSNIPVMAPLGNTFAYCAKEMLLFCCVLMGLLLAFSFPFNIIFCTVTEEFGTFAQSVFTVFLGLVGGMQTASLFSANPVLGPVLFASYLFVVLFTAFTLIIALITDAYEKVKDNAVPKGACHHIAKQIFGQSLVGRDDNNNNNKEEDILAQILRMQQGLTEQLKLQQAQMQQLQEVVLGQGVIHNFQVDGNKGGQLHSNSVKLGKAFMPGASGTRVNLNEMLKRSHDGPSNEDDPQTVVVSI